MRSAFALSTLFFWAAVTLAIEVPEEVAVTSENSAELGFELVAIDSGSPDVKLVELRFPTQVGERLLAKRVQTYLFDSEGLEISSTSVDYKYEVGNPRLLMHFNVRHHDAAMVVQYVCTRESGGRCAKAYTIESVKDYLITNGSM